MKENVNYLPVNLLQSKKTCQIFLPIQPLNPRDCSQLLSYPRWQMVAEMTNGLRFGLKLSRTNQPAFQPPNPVSMKLMRQEILSVAKTDNHVYLD